MANWITGSTDTTGALQVTPKSPKSLLMVGVGAAGITPEKLYDITGTIDATTYFGADSPFVEITRAIIQNGADNIKGIVIGESDSDGEPYADVADAYEAAFAKSLENSTIKVIIVDTTAEAAVFARLKAHLNLAEANDMFRYGVVGAPIGSDINEYVALAASLGDKRIFLAGPNVVDNAGAEKDGTFTAACLAAKIMSETSDPALPMNNVTFQMYPSVASVLQRTARDSFANSGVTALYPDGGVPTIWRLVTTYTTDAIWQEGTTIFIADDVLESVINRLKANYKRTKNVARVLDSIKTDVISVLSGKEGLEIIQNFDQSTVSVVRDPSDLYGALVDYAIQVVTPLYTITIQQHLKL